MLFSPSFGFRELTVPSDNNYDRQTHLGLADITFDHPNTPIKDGSAI